MVQVVHSPQAPQGLRLTVSSDSQLIAPQRSGFQERELPERGLHMASSARLQPAAPRSHQQDAQPLISQAVCLLQGQCKLIHCRPGRAGVHDARVEPSPARLHPAPARTADLRGRMRSFPRAFPVSARWRMSTSGTIAHLTWPFRDPVDCVH